MIFQGIFGKLDNPLTDPGGGASYGSLTDPNQGLVKFVNNLIALLTVAAGIWVVVNFIIAGYIYLGANGQPQKITDAGNKIMQSAIGLAIVALTYVIAAVLGEILYGSPTALLSPIFYKIF
jgi:hypothetical protein